MDWNGLSEAVGCIHIHSLYSDGSGTIREISEEAREAGLDFIMITDHNNLRALKNGEEGWYDSVLTLIGYEINDVNDANHYLAFGLEEEIDKNLPAVEYVRRVREQGGFGIIAHPDEQRNRMPEHPSYPWNAWESEDYQGIEIWNQMSEWMEGLSPWNKFWRFVNPRKSIIAPLRQTLNRWDEVSHRRKVVGIGGVDAHAHKHEIFGGLIQLTVFRYKVQFKSVRTHLLLPQPLQKNLPLEQAKQLVYDALLGCRVFISNYFNGNARGFRCLAENKHGVAGIGGELAYAPGTRLSVKLPAAGEMYLVNNGQTIAQQRGQVGVFSIPRPGLYRVEVFRKKRAWIFSNHLRITDENVAVD
ncbi:MAG: CehA/McbA family metallohydrolase [Calditrichia bacterium]